MNTRRSFFQRIAGLVAAVAIAPEIAFRTKLALPEAEQQIVIGWDIGNVSNCTLATLPPGELERLFSSIEKNDWVRLERGTIKYHLEKF